MQFLHPFYKLPIQIDHTRLLKELEQIKESEWMAHPSGFKGNSALILASVNGQDNNDTAGAIKLTARMDKLPYCKQILSSFNTVIGRARLMRLAPGAVVKRHTDINYYWRHRMRIHIPIVTAEGVDFYCDDQKAHLKAGEVWTLDTWRVHEVHNNSNVTRIHLVFDTVGSPYIWDLLENKSWNPSPESLDTPESFKPKLIQYNEKSVANIVTEKCNVETILHPSEVESIATECINDLNREYLSDVDQQNIEISLIRLYRHWRSLWAEYGNNESATRHYLMALNTCVTSINSIQKKVCFKSNNNDLAKTLRIQIGVGLASQNTLPVSSENNKTIKKNFFDRPVIILAAPRSGSTLLYETLANHRLLWSINGESHRHIEGISALNALTRTPISNVLSAADADDMTAQQVRASFKESLVNSNQSPITQLNVVDTPGSIRFLEKTPKNALRVPFLNRVFPDAIYIYLQRSPEENISSIMEGWKSGKYITYKNLPNWKGNYPWSYLLPNDWESVNGQPLADIASFQYISANREIMKSVQSLPKENVYVVDYDDFLENTKSHLKAMCNKADLPFGEKMKEVGDKPLPLSRFTLDAPRIDKWKKNEKAMANVLDAAKQFHQDMVKFRITRMGDGE